MRKSRLPFFLVAVLAVGLAPRVLHGQTQKRDLLTKEEIMAPAMKDLDLLQIVRLLRPHFLRPPRGVRSMVNGPPAPIQLYVNDNPRAGLDDLKSIKPEEVEEIRYLEPSRAQDQYGITHSGGALLVKLRGPGIRPPGP
jgi:hypothetical protein